MGKRLKEIRKLLGLSQEAFGERLGVTGTAISRIESGERSLTEQMAKSICREFKVDYFWLMEGIGDKPFIEIPSTLIDEIAEQYGLDEIDKTLLKGYLELSDDERSVFKNFFSKVFK